MSEISPLMLEQMLIAYWSTDPNEKLIMDDRYDSEAGRKARNWLKDQGLLDSETNKATERGRVWVEAILRTPLPVQTWTMPEASTKDR